MSENLGEEALRQGSARSKTNRSASIKNQLPSMTDTAEENNNK